MTTISDVARRQLIVQQSQDTPRDPHGVTLDIKISLHGGGHGFIRAKGADDLSCANDLIIMAELAKLIDQLRRKQLQRENRAA